ncbi:unnamed protein product [Lactuca virosa]|uniref:Lipoyl-binding domain-containing protein n=1 Tax=Lactuca virosa TaxID=75947 RepID=A0AAU9PHV3_9ASTR|nr:unnamed protein product [Lactuca virosa]
MPSLSPTITEANIARCLKKEGDQVAPGEVLCEETDKGTVEMECMEEGYLAKIIHGDGAKEIQVGEISVMEALHKSFYKACNESATKGERVTFNKFKNVFMFNELEIVEFV